MWALRVMRNRSQLVKVEREEDGVIVAYSLPGEPGSWYFPLIEKGKNVDNYKILSREEYQKIVEGK